MNYELYEDKIKSALKGGYEKIGNTDISEEVIKEYTDKLIIYLNTRKDARSIKSEEELYKAFFNADGPLNAFYKVVLAKQDEKDLWKRPVIGFRGDRIIIYYYNHKLWELSKSRGGQFKVQFDFNHAKNYSEWKEKYQILCNNYGFRQPKRDEKKVVRLSNDNSMIMLTRSSGKKKYSDGEYGDVIGGEIGSIYCKKDFFDETFVKTIYEIFSSIMDSYIRDKVDLFRELVWKEKELSISPEHQEQVSHASNTDNESIEKKWQQRLFNHFKYIDGENGDVYTFAYDLEFSQKYPSEEIEKLFDCNEPDLMAIRFENGKAVRFQLIEVKSKKSACTGKSGIEKHIEGMKAYSELEFFMKSRIEDAIALFEAYKKTGLYPKLTDELIKSINEIDIKNGIEKIILLTGCDEIDETEEQKESALDYVNEVLIKKCRKIDPDCQFWYTENKYYDSEIEIKTDIIEYIQNKQVKKIKPKVAKKSVSNKRKEIVNHPIYGVGEVKKVKDDIATIYFGKEMKTISYAICQKRNWIVQE